MVKLFDLEGIRGPFVSQLYLRTSIYVFAYNIIQMNLLFCISISKRALDAVLEKPSPVGKHVEFNKRSLLLYFIKEF